MHYLIGIFQRRGKRSTFSEDVALVGKYAWAKLSGKTAQLLAADAKEVVENKGKATILALNNVWKNRFAPEADQAATGIIAELRSGAMADLKQNGVKASPENLELIAGLAIGGDEELQAILARYPLKTRLQLLYISPKTTQKIRTGLLAGGAALGTGTLVAHHKDKEAQRAASVTEDTAASAAPEAAAEGPATQEVGPSSVSSNKRGLGDDIDINVK